MSQTVYVGLSGGVDSSLSAVLLKEQGYNVVGVYMKNWTQDLPGFACPWKEDFQDAKRLAVRLNIPFEVFDFEAEYKQKVVDYMIDEYKRGRTPNPDIMCNQEVKFKLFLETSLEKGAEKVATGHYARTSTGQLLKAVNSAKDQTYFLCRVTSEALEKTIFPIGEFATKDEVRAMAERFGLDTAHKKDSQGICFVGKVGIKDFLKQYVQTKSGPIIDQNGRQIGEHDGSIFYTIGQRHGLNVGGGLPYYVTGKDMDENKVFVTNDINDSSLWSKTVGLESIHWINDPPSDEKSYDVQLRYRGALIKSKIKSSTLYLDQEQRAVSVGQSAVIYDQDRVVGSGIISTTQ